MTWGFHIIHTYIANWLHFVISKGMPLRRWLKLSCTALSRASWRIGRWFTAIAAIAFDPSALDSGSGTSWIIVGHVDIDMGFHWFQAAFRNLKIFPADFTRSESPWPKVGCQHKARFGAIFCMIFIWSIVRCFFQWNMGKQGLNFWLLLVGIPMTVPSRRFVSIFQFLRFCCPAQNPGNVLSQSWCFSLSNLNHQGFPGFPAFGSLEGKKSTRQGSSREEDLGGATCGVSWT